MGDESLMKAMSVFTNNSVLSTLRRLLQPLQQERKTEREREKEGREGEGGAKRVGKKEEREKGEKEGQRKRGSRGREGKRKEEGRRKKGRKERILRMHFITGPITGNSSSHHKDPQLIDFTELTHV